MHELAVAQALLDQVELVAQERGAVSVASVTVKIGPLSSVEPGLLERAFEVARLRSACTAAAQITIEMAAVRVRCSDCGQDGAGHSSSLACPYCGSRGTRLLQGDELLLMQVALDLPLDGHESGACHV